MSADIARRAVVCPGWRWLPGMLAIRWTGPCRGSHRYTDADVRAGVIFYDGFPDLDDPATLGCLLALVREAYGQPSAFCRYVESDPAFWHINTGHVGATEAEALVAALEAAA